MKSTDAYFLPAEFAHIAGMDLNRHTQEWIAAWNSHHLARIYAHYAGVVELISPLVTALTGQSEGSVSGKAALRDYFAGGLQTYLTLRFNFIRLYSGVRSWVVECHSVHGLRTAERMEFGESGKVRRVLAHYRDEALGGSPVWSAP